MLFSHDQLAKIAAWEPAIEEFTHLDPVESYIRPALARLNSAGPWGCQTIFNGDLSNYYFTVVHRRLTRDDLRISRYHKPVVLEGLGIYLNLMIPVGVLGYTSVSIASDNNYGANFLRIDSVVHPQRGTVAVIDAVLDAFGESPYTFIDRDAVNQPLPNDIRPNEYCLCEEPWDRVFHALFANTD